MLFQILLDGILLGEDSRTIRVSLVWRDGVRRQVVVHDVGIACAEQHQVGSIRVAHRVRLRGVFAILHVVHLLVSVVVERKVVATRRGHRATATMMMMMVVCRVDGMVFPRAKTQHSAHDFQFCLHSQLSPFSDEIFLRFVEL